MTQVFAEDITVPWGRVPDPIDQQTSRWRRAVFQDVQASVDGSKLYWLYDPIEDEHSGTSGPRKGPASIVIFDANMRCFVREMVLRVMGVPKYLFALKVPAPSGATAFVLCTQIEAYGEITLQMWRINLRADGMEIDQTIELLQTPIPIRDDWIVCMREDVPEIVILTSPGLTVWRVNALVDQSTTPIDSFQVPDGNLQAYYDGFIANGSVYLLSSTPDGLLDWSRVHVLNITDHSRLVTRATAPDVQRGFPTARKQAAIDTFGDQLLLAGGEIDYGRGQVHRLVDYWALDLTTCQWHQMPGQMPLPLIEPRLTVTIFGQIFLWGDIDQPLPGVSTTGTHIRILRLTGIAPKPPSYEQATAYPSTTPGGYPMQQQQQQPYPSNLGYGQQQQQQYPSAGGYPQAQGGYPTQQPHQGGYPTQQPPQGGYPTQQPPQGGYPTQQPPQGGYPTQQPPQGGYPTQQPPQYGMAYGYQPPNQQQQHAVYPPSGGNKKDCSIS